MDFDTALKALEDKRVKVEVNIRAAIAKDEDWKPVAALKAKDTVNEYTAAFERKEKEKKVKEAKPKKQVVNLLNFAQPPARPPRNNFKRDGRDFDSSRGRAPKLANDKAFPPLGEK